MGTWLGRLVGGGFIVGLWATALSAQQRPITGVVKDRASGTPIAGARITVDGSSARAETTTEGRYTLRLTPSGAITIRVFAVGYKSQSRTVSRDSLAQSVDFDLSPSVVQLDEIVTTATGDQRRLEVGAVVGVVRADSLVAATQISNVADVLNSRVAGVSVQTQTGTTGAASRIRIRGANSISLSNEPIVIIDGIRAQNDPLGSSIDIGGQTPSRFNDLNPDDLESIEVVKGPSAATLYGTEAANGVVVIKTKRGRVGASKWNFYVEGGLSQDKNQYPDNYTADPFVPAVGIGCALFLAADGVCQQDSLVTFNPLRNSVTSPLGTGYQGHGGFNVSGGSDQLRYYFGADFNSQVGVFRIPDAERDSVLAARGIGEIPGEQYRPNALRRVSLRTAVTAPIARNLELDATVGYVQNQTRLPQNDNNILGITSNGYLGSPDPSAPWLLFGPAASFSHTNQQRVNRISGSVTTRWTPSGSLAARLVVGLDQTDESDQDYARAGEAPDFGLDTEGNRTLNKFTIGVYSVDGAVTANRNLSEAFRSKTTLGAQYYTTRITGALAFGNRIAAGSNTIDGAGQLTASSQHTTSANGGIYLEEVVAWREKLFLTGAARLDQASAFARTQGAVLLPKASVSYVALNRTGGTLNLLRFRGSYGQSLVAPTALVQLQSLLPVTGVRADANVPTVTANNLGNPDLRPERSREFEAGIDASFFGDRLSVELTGYDKHTKDALVNRPLAPSLGTALTQFYNIGSTKNQGLELSLTAQLLNGKNLGLDLQVVGALLKNRLVALGEGIEPFPLGFSQRMVPGLPMAGYWDQTTSFTDANGDGLLSVDEITVSDTAVYIGPSIPTREVTVTPQLSLWGGRVRLSSQWNYRGGHFLDNTTEFFRCGSFLNCRALYDPSVPLADQAYATASLLIGGFAGKIEKADFLRLREVAATFTAPVRWARMVGASSASVTIAGRNLAVWTSYHGIDPETSAFGALAFSTSDFFTQPPVRYWTVRLNLGY